MLQAISLAGTRHVHPNRPLLNSFLPVFLQAVLVPDCRQRVQPGFWAEEVLGCAHPAGKCRHTAGQRYLAGQTVCISLFHTSAWP